MSDRRVNLRKVASQFSAAGKPDTRMLPGAAARTCDRKAVRFQLGAILRARLDLVPSLPEPAEEVRRRQLIERRLGALEGELRHALSAEPATAEEVQHRRFTGTFDLEPCPRSPVNRPVQPEVSIGVIQLEEDFRFREPTGAVVWAPGSDGRCRHARKLPTQSKLAAGTYSVSLP